MRRMFNRLPNRLLACVLATTLLSASFAVSVHVHVDELSDQTVQPSCACTDHQEESPSVPCDHSDDCQLCKFFGQYCWIECPDADWTADLAREFFEPTTAAICDLDAAHGYQGRAPPIV